MQKGRNVLVAGGTGLVGTALVRRLHQLGAAVRATHHSRPPTELAELSQRCDFTSQGDCRDATRDMQDVFVCAAQTFGAQIMKERPTSLVLPNLAINSGLFEACRESGVERVVFVSSSTVYQEAFYPIREDQLDLNQQPFQLYQGVGWMKRYVEQLARFYHDRYGMKVAIVRPTNIYGPHDKFDDDKSHVLPALIKRALKREDPFVVWGTGNTVRDFLYVEDFVDDLLLILERCCNADPINVAHGESIRVSEAVSVILDACGHHVAPQYDPSKPEAVPYRILDTTKAAAILGRRARTSFAAGIEATVRWYRDVADLARAA